MLPPESFEFLATVAPGLSLAWDCGLANEQAAGAIAEHFAWASATDASAEPIEPAHRHPMSNTLWVPPAWPAAGCLC